MELELTGVGLRWIANMSDKPETAVLNQLIDSTALTAVPSGSFVDRLDLSIYECDTELAIYCDADGVWKLAK